MILGANLDNPTATRDTLLGMLRGKPELSDQVSVGILGNDRFIIWSGFGRFTLILGSIILRLSC